jgi:hypothetical protein
MSSESELKLPLDLCRAAIPVECTADAEIKAFGISAAQVRESLLGGSFGKEVIEIPALAVLADGS